MLSLGQNLTFMLSLYGCWVEEDEWKQYNNL